MAGLPFLLRRPWLMLRDLCVDRDRPDLDGLRAIQDPERFVWAVLPHAARTFSACIMLLPAGPAKAAAVAYLYCRILDTYEDLCPDPAAREALLLGFVERLQADPDPPPPPPIEAPALKDDRDRAHLLLIEKCDLVDRVYLELPAEVRAITRRLVRDMAEGMCWSSRIFGEQGGVLQDGAQVARYCHNVMGNPVLFTLRLLRHDRSGETELPAELEQSALEVSEMIQLANITRDIEKDLLRGVSYRAALRDDLGRQVDGDVSLAGRVRDARRELMRAALSRAPAYRALIDAMEQPHFSPARASALLMLLFTDRYYRSCARRAGLAAWGGRPPGLRLVLQSLPAVWSRRWARNVCDRVEQDFLNAADGGG